MKSYVGQNCVLECLATPNAWRRNKIDAPVAIRDLKFRELTSLLSWLVNSVDIIARAQRTTPNPALGTPATGSELDWLLSTPVVAEIVTALEIKQLHAASAVNRQRHGFAATVQDGAAR